MMPAEYFNAWPVLARPASNSRLSVPIPENSRAWTNLPIFLFATKESLHIGLYLGWGGRPQRKKLSLLLYFKKINEKEKTLVIFLDQSIPRDDLWHIIQDDDRTRGRANLVLLFSDDLPLNSAQRNDWEGVAKEEKQGSPQSQPNIATNI